MLNTSAASAKNSTSISQIIFLNNLKKLYYFITFLWNFLQPKMFADEFLRKLPKFSVQVKLMSEVSIQVYLILLNKKLLNFAIENAS